MGKLSHKIWVKVIAFLLIGVFLFQQTAYARHYTPDEGLKDFFKSDADQAIMYVAGTVLSIAIPASGLLGPVSNSTLIISAGVNIGSQAAVASGADPKSTMIVGGAVGGLTSGFVNGGNLTSNLGLQTMVVNVAPWTASATVSAYVGENNPIVGSLAGMATGVAVSSGLNAIAPGDFSASGKLIPKEQADILKNSTIPTDKYGNAVITTPDGQLYSLNLDANNNIVIKGPGADGTTVIATYAEPGTNIHTPIGSSVEVTGILGKDGRPITPENPQYIQSKLVFVESFINKVSPQLINQAVQVSRITNIYGPLPTDVARVPLSYYGEKYGAVGGFVVGAIKGLQNLGPGILTQTAVQYALYEALGGDNKPYAGPLANFAGSLTGAYVNERFGQWYAGLSNPEIKYNPWTRRPADLDFGYFMAKLAIRETVRAGVNIGFNYLDESIKSETFPGLTSLALNTGKLFSGVFAASLVDMALPTKTDVAIKNDIDIYKIDKDYLKGTELEEIRPHTFAETFSQGLKTNFREALFNTFPIYIPSLNTGTNAIPAYVNYIQEQLRLNVAMLPFINVAYAFSGNLANQGASAFSHASADLLSNSFMPASYKTYMAAFKFKDMPKPVVASYHMQVPEDAYLARLQEETRLDEAQLGKYIEVSKQSVSEAPETLSPADQYALAEYKEGVSRTEKLYEATKLIAKLGVDSEPVVITLDLTDLAGIPLTKLTFKQERTFDIPQDRLLELIEREWGGVPSVIYDKDTGIIREHIESGRAILGIAGYTRDLRLSAVTPMDRWGRDLRTVYYGMDSQGNQELKPEKTTLYYYGPFGRILSSTFNMDEKKFKESASTMEFARSYDPFKALEYKQQGLEGIIYHDLSLYTSGRIDRVKPLLSLDVTEITKGPALRMAANIPEVLNKIEAAKMRLGMLDEIRTKLTTLPADFVFDEPKFNTLMSLVEGTLDPKADATLANVKEALNKLAQEKIEDKTKGITVEDADYFISGLSYLINENKPLPSRLQAVDEQIQALRNVKKPINYFLPDIPLSETYTLNQLTDLLSGLKEFEGRFKINEAYRDLDMVREATFNYIMEVVPQKGRFERLPVFTFISGFEGPKPTLLLTANYDYTRDPASLTDADSWAHRALQWFRNQGKDLKGVQVNIAGRDLWFLKKEGSERLYPAGYGPYYYSGAGDIPRDIRDILTGADWRYKDYLGTTTVGAGNPLVNTGSKSEIK